MTPPTAPCGVFEDDLALLALGVLTGRERAVLLEHIEACPSCAATVESLTRAADAMLEAVPEREPPLGFEVRVHGRLGIDSGGPTRVSGQRATLLAAAAVALAILGVLVGRASAPTSSSASGPGTRIATLTSQSGAEGTVLASSGHPAWLVMTVRDDHHSGDVTCEIATAGGRWMAVGTFPLYRGSGSWTTTIPVRVASLARARLVAANGNVLASASFSS